MNRSVVLLIAICATWIGAQDTCATALTLSAGANGPYSFSGMTGPEAGFGSGCATGDGATNPDMFFSYTAAVSGTAIIGTCFGSDHPPTTEAGDTIIRV